MKKAIAYIIICAVILGHGSLFSQENATDKKNTSFGSSGNDYTRDERIPQLYKRLSDAIQALKLKPDDEGKYTLTIKSGNQYDLVDRVFFVFNKKALIYAAQGRISKIVFEYYQFNMTTHVREVKTYTFSTPDSADLRALAVDYVNNIGQKENYTVADLRSLESRMQVTRQFYSYYLAMVYKLELYKDKTTRSQSSKILRAIQLGD